MTTSHRPARALGPGALDDPELRSLARCVTVDDAATRFGTARVLAESVLGRPRDRGHATADVIRAIGRLLLHPLGPALAAEAVTLAAVVGDVLDTGAIRDLLALAWSSDAAGRPIEPAAADRLWSRLRTSPPGARRTRILRHWRLTRSELGGTSDCAWSPAAQAAVIATAPERYQVALTSAAPDPVARHLAAWPHVWSLEPPVVRVLYERCPDALLANRCCPDSVASALAWEGVRAGPSVPSPDAVHDVPRVLQRRLRSLDRTIVGPERWYEPDQRPRPPGVWDPYDDDDHDDDDDEWRAASFGIPGRFRPRVHHGYGFPTAEEIAALDGATIAGDWRVRVVDDWWELVRNGRAMANCTASYWDEIADGDYVVVRLAGPDRSIYNVGLSAAGGGDGWILDQAHGRHNRGIPPDGVVEALVERANTVARPAPAARLAPGDALHPLERRRPGDLVRRGPYRPSNARLATRRAAPARGGGPPAGYGVMASGGVAAPAAASRAW
jgi:hypothetical protein